MSTTNILIVEDEANVAATIARQLRRLGYGVSGNTAYGEDAVALSRDLHPDLILMDIRLEGKMDGVEAAEVIRRECGTPVIYLTAHSDSTTLERARLTEPFGFLLKPFDELALKIHIETALYRHRIERKLRESEERLARTQEIAHLGSWELDLIGNNLSWSDEVYRIFGLQPQEFGATYEAFLDRVHPDDRAAVNEAYSGSLRENRDSYEIEHRIVRQATGEVRWVHERCQHRRDAAGKIVLSLGMVQDITARKRGQEALRASEARYRSLFENNIDAIFSVDCKGRFLNVNPAAEALCGYSCEELQSLVFTQLCAPDHLEKTMASFETRLREEIPAIESAIVCKDGRRVELLVSGVPMMTDGRTTGLFCIARDITLHKHVELERSFSIELFDLANASNSTRSFVQAVASSFQRRSECDAVAIHLRQDEDYPCFESRARCRSEGYRSMASIPLGGKACRIGLLQLNSLKKGYFTPDLIALWERLAEKVAIAITKFQAEEALQNAHEELEQRVVERTAELNRANRALLMLQECAVAYARATNEFELLESVCEIILRIDGLKLAWVGFAEDDQKKTVRPVAQAGDNAGYLKTAKITWADEARGRGPTGTAIRTHTVTVCHDICADERLAPWRKQQLKRGYTALIALPLLWRERCLGALNIYSAHTDAFNKQEIELLSRLADDLTYGIVALRTRAERTELQKELLRISECEKQTIAQELHDGLCQHFAGTAFMGNLLFKRLAARNDPDAAHAKQICDLLNTGVHETRTLSHGLHPVKAGGEGLMEALAGLAQTVTALFHVQCAFHCDDSVPISDQTVATHLFRIAQEAVANARKHGEARRVVVALKRSREGVVLSIRDNGIGIPTVRRASAGMGLKIMNHRAEAIGARLSIGRRGKRGTAVTCTVPIHE